MWEGSSENAAVAIALLADLVRARPRYRAGRAVRAASWTAPSRPDTLGTATPVQGYVRHKSET
jgi:hypothetical protein